MTNDTGGKDTVSLKGGGGSREYMADFARGRQDLHCESCGFNMRRNSDFGTTSDREMTEQYCSVCYEAGAFRHPAASVDEFISAAVEDIASARKQSTGKLKLQLKKDLPKLARWKK
ncbi:MAG: zinc ribbon domain-containing protein [Dehalococcoidia bacterium]|nr:zinc ribbon domain-containing protein [Dehalococcoidia bacterium]